MPPVVPFSAPCRPPRAPRVAVRTAGLLLLLVLAPLGCGADRGTGPGGGGASDAPVFLGARSGFVSSVPLDDVSDIQLAPDGTLLVHRYDPGRVARYDPTGALLSTWPTVTDSSDGQPVELYGMRLGRDGLLYFVESGYAHPDWTRIVRITIEGQFRGALNVYGVGDSLLAWTNEFDADAAGNLYALQLCCDDLGFSARGKFRVLKFAPDGRPLAQWGARGSGDGEFERPVRLAVAPDGTVCVADAELLRVQRFDAEGHFLNRAADAPPSPYAYAYAGLTITPSNEIFVPEASRNLLSDTNIIHRFGLDGAPRGTRELTAPEGRDFNLESMTVDAAGRLAVWDGAESTLRHFASDGAQDFMIGGRTAPGSTDFLDLSRLMPAAGGGVFALDRYTSKLLRIDAQGRTSLAWRRGPNNALDLGPTATDSAGRLFMLASGGTEILELGTDGHFRTAFRLPPRFWDLLRHAQALAAGPDGRFLALVPGYRVPDVALAFDATGEVLGQWDLLPAGNDDFRYAQRIAVDGLGRFWVLYGGGFVYSEPPPRYRFVGRGARAFDSSGRPLVSVALDSTAVGVEMFPRDLAFDPSGNLVISGTLIRRESEGRPARGVIALLDPRGRLIARWGDHLAGEAEFQYPNAVALDAAGIYYIFDATSPGRLLRFGPAGRGGGP